MDPLEYTLGEGRDLNIWDVEYSNNSKIFIKLN